jgi:hypothetical protein
LVHGGVPAFAAFDAQVGCQDVELLAIRGADDGGVAQPFFAQVRLQNGLGIVEVLPVQAILARREIDLFAIGGLAGEVHQQIARIGRRHGRCAEHHGRHEGHEPPFFSFTEQHFSCLPSLCAAMLAPISRSLQSII